MATRLLLCCHHRLLPHWQMGAEWACTCEPRQQEWT